MTGEISPFDFTINLNSNIAKVKQKNRPKNVKEYYQLNVYKAAINLVKQLTNSTQQAPSHVKTGLLKDAQEKIIHVVFLIQQAANKENIVDNLSKALYESRELLITIRVFMEMGYIKDN